MQSLIVIGWHKELIPQKQHTAGMTKHVKPMFKDIVEHMLGSVNLALKDM
jgi:hypothetical protein